MEKIKISDEELERRIYDLIERHRFSVAVRSGRKDEIEIEYDLAMAIGKAVLSRLEYFPLEDENTMGIRLVCMKPSDFIDVMNYFSQASSLKGKEEK